MTSFFNPWLIPAVWVSLTLVGALVLDASSVRGWLLVATFGIAPALVYLALRNDGPPLTVAEVLHATETDR